MQGLAWNPECFGKAAHGAVRLGQFGGNQRTLEVLDLLTEVTTARYCRVFLEMWWCFAIERQLQP
ncbi:hypothetical protein D3C86_2267930 [compost metagenome]